MTHFLWQTPYSITMAKISPAHKPSKQNAASGAKPTLFSWTVLLLKLEDQRLRIMMSRFFTCVLPLLRFCLSAGSYTPQTLPDIGDAEFIEKCMREHNKFRSEVSPPASDMLYMVRGSSLLTCKRAALIITVFAVLRDDFCNQMLKKKKGGRKKETVSGSHSSNSFLQQIRVWLSDGFIWLGTCIVLPGSVSLSETRDFNPQPGAVAGAVKSLLIPRHRSPGCDLCADLSTTFHTRVGEGGEHCQKALKSSALAFSANLSRPEPAESY